MSERTWSNILPGIPGLRLSGGRAIPQHCRCTFWGAMYPKLKYKTHGTTGKRKTDVWLATAVSYPARLLSHACNPFSAEMLAFANAPGCIIALYDLCEQANDPQLKSPRTSFSQPDIAMS